MAEGKKSFLLYCDILHTVEHLTDEQAGKLFKHIVAYVNDKNPKTEDIIIKLAFEPIKHQLKRDLKEWEETRKERSESGKRGMAVRWGNKAKQNITKDNTAITGITNDNKPLQGITKITVTDTVNVNDTVTVNDNVNEREIIHTAKKVFKKPTLTEILGEIADPNEAERFFNYYESNGWKVGKNSMKSWPAAAKNWLKNNYGTHQQPIKHSVKTAGAYALLEKLRSTAGGKTNS